jgi:DNA gyrase inhibitor GyrI
MDEARVVELPWYRVVKLRYEGPPPPSPAFLEHWDRFNAWTERHNVKSVHDDVWAIGYQPPLLRATRSMYRMESLVYDACVPVGGDFVLPEGEGFEMDQLPGGRYVLCRGIIREFPLLYQEARQYAMQRGLAVERGGIERYLPHPPESEVHPVDAGYRIHE